VRFHRRYWIAGFLMGAAAISRLRPSHASAANPEEILDLYFNRALKVHDLPENRKPDQTIIEKLNKSDIGVAYKPILPGRSILIHDCKLTEPSWCDNPAFSFESMFREAAKIAKPRVLNAEKLVTAWYKNLTNPIQDAVLPFDTLRKAPFQLLAIANRMDLAQLGDPRSGAEIHFAYGLRPAPGATTAPEVLVILEFRLPEFAPDKFKDLATTWEKLSHSPLSTYQTDLLDALQKAGFSADPNKPEVPTRLRSVSSRFNLSVTGSEWGLSQLTLDPESTDDTAHSQFAKARLEDQLLPNADQLQPYPALFTAGPGILPGGTLHVPIGADIQAKSAITYNAYDIVRPPGGVCDAEGNRAILAIQQCTFCHGSETGTNFAHIANRVPDGPGVKATPSRLSTFLAGKGRDESTAHPNLADLYYGTGPVSAVELSYDVFPRAVDGTCTKSEPKTVYRYFHDIARRTLFMAAILTDPLPNSSQAHLKKAKPSAPGAASRFGTTMKD